MSGAESAPAGRKTPLDASAPTPHHASDAPLRPLLQPLRRIAGMRRLLYDRRLRSELLTRWTAREAVHRHGTLTRLDRYPRLFAAVQAELGAKGAHTILSFGCSSGEEVVSLRRYFPASTVIGAELNPAQLAACARWPADSRAHFIPSTRDGIAERGPFDAIFCMAVLQRRPYLVEARGLTDLARYYPFARFADEVAFLSAQLRPGGLLVVEHCQYQVEDVAAPLALVAGPTRCLAEGARFDRSGAILVTQPVVARLFRRI